MFKLNLLKSFHSFQLDLSFELPKKGLIVLEGTSGCGKSTTLNLLSGKLKNEIDSFLPLDCYYMESKSLLLPNKTIKEILTIVENENQKEITKTILQMLNLEKHLHQKIKKLSEGEKRLVDFVLAILSNKSIILMDEPHAMIHENIIEKQIEIIQNLASDKLFIIATHKIQYYKEVAQTIYVLKDGKIVETTHNEKTKDFSSILLFKTNSLKKEKQLLKYQFHFPVFLFAFCILLIFCVGLSFLSYNQAIINTTTDEDLNRYELGLFEYDHQAEFKLESQVTNQQKNQLVQEVAQQENLETDYLITLYQYYIVNMLGETNQPRSLSDFDFHYFFNEEHSNIIGKEETADNEIYVSTLFMTRFAYFYPSYQQDQYENFLSTNPSVTFYSNSKENSKKATYQIVGIFPSDNFFISHSFFTSEEFFNSWLISYEIVEDETLSFDNNKIVFLKQYYLKDLTSDNLKKLENKYPNYEFSLSNQQGFVTLKEKIQLNDFEQKINNYEYILAYQAASIKTIKFNNDYIHYSFLYVMKEEYFFYENYKILGTKESLKDNEIYISEGFYLRYLKDKKETKYLGEFLDLSVGKYKIKGILTSFYDEAIFFNSTGYKNMFEPAFLVNTFYLYLEDTTQIKTYQKDLRINFPLYNLSKYEDSYIRQKIDDIVNKIEIIKKEQNQQQKIYQYLIVFFFILTFILFYFQMRMSKKYFQFYQMQQIKMNKINIGCFILSLALILIVYIVINIIFENILIEQFYQKLIDLMSRPEFNFRYTYHFSWLIFAGVVFILIMQNIPWWGIKNELFRKRKRKIS